DGLTEPQQEEVAVTPQGGRRGHDGQPAWSVPISRFSRRSVVERVFTHVGAKIKGRVCIHYVYTCSPKSGDGGMDWPSGVTRTTSSRPALVRGPSYRSTWAGGSAPAAG